VEPEKEVTMTSASIVWVVLIVWPVIAVVLAWVLARRGHDPWTWLVMGLLFGPLAILLAGYSARHEDEAVEVLAGPADHEDDRLDVLVGFDGSAESQAALRLAERLLGDRIDRLTLARVIPFDPGRFDDRDAQALLLKEARMLTDRPVGLEVIHGQPATALQSVARRDGYHLVVVGTAHQPSHLGSAARELAGSSSVPVLVAPAEHQPARSTR
jgi:nucleotide-binding universal stress UspA family protein